MATGFQHIGAGTARPENHPVQLGHEGSFRLGPLTIEPALRRIAHGDGREEIVEPRVMQVLVALYRAEGGILTKSDLIECCWSGRIVGDDAINRVISRLRRVAETLGQGVFHIATITKVGYRLVLEEAELRPGDAAAGDPPRGHAVQPVPAEIARPAAWLNRRVVLSGSAAVLAAAVPAVWAALRDTDWLGLGGHVPAPEAKRLYDEGMKAQYQGLTGTSDQAEAYFRQAAAADPEWADAWGSLAMSYRHMLDGETNVSQWRLVEQTRSAAGRALELDPNNAEALVALALIRTPYRRWHEAEARYLELVERFPQAFVLRGHLGRLLRDVGRFGDAVLHGRISVQQQPFVPFTSLGLAFAYWGAGRLHEAESEVERAIARWPKFIPVWFHRFEFLTYTGRPEAAIAFASNREARPTELPEFLFERRIVTARALATRTPADIDAAVAEQTLFIERSLGQPPHVLAPAFSVPFFVAIGDLETAFALIEGYFFDRGRYAPPVRRPFGPLTRRDSAFLFMPMNAALTADRRFQPLLEEIGLEDYWRRTGSTPDFRRAAARQARQKIAARVPQQAASA